MMASIYFSYGMTKCGSTFAYELVRRLFEVNGYPQTHLPGPRASDAADILYLDNLNEARLGPIRDAQAGPVAIKTHAAPTDAVRELLKSGQVVGHAVYRDPRDMALSLLDHGTRARASGERAFSEIATLDDAIAAIDRQLETLSAWLRLPCIMPLYFEDVVYRTTNNVGILKSQIGLWNDGNVAAEGDEDAISDHVRSTRFTQFNQGVRRRWRTEMSQEDSERIKTRFAPLIRRMIRRRSELRLDGRPILGPRQTLRRQHVPSGTK